MQKFSAEELMELNRLHSLGIPVPGLLIKVDKATVRVWLEDMEVEPVGEGASKVLVQRVKAVLERSVEVVSGIAGA
jgi:cleavage and polyadenylation specificity factor subunit 3